MRLQVGTSASLLMALTLVVTQMAVAAPVLSDTAIDGGGPSSSARSRRELLASKLAGFRSRVAGASSQFWKATVSKMGGRTYIQRPGDSRPRLLPTTDDAQLMELIADMNLEDGQSISMEEYMKLVSAYHRRLEALNAGMPVDQLPGDEMEGFSGSDPNTWTPAPKPKREPVSDGTSGDGTSVSDYLPDFPSSSSYLDPQQMEDQFAGMSFEKPRSPPTTVRFDDYLADVKGKLPMYQPTEVPSRSEEPWYAGTEYENWLRELQEGSDGVSPDYDDIFAPAKPLEDDMASHVYQKQDDKLESEDSGELILNRARPQSPRRVPVQWQPLVHQSMMEDPNFALPPQATLLDGDW